MEIPKDAKFFWKGEFYPNEDDFNEAMAEWAYKKADQTSFDILFDLLKKDMIINLEVRGKSMTNRELESIMGRCFKDFCKWLNESQTNSSISSI